MDSQIGPQVESSGKKSGSRFGKVFAYASMNPLKAVGAAAVGLFAVDKMKDFFTSAVSEARESQKVSALTAQVIKSTGGAAGVSAKQVGNLATSISNMTGIDDEAIQSGENMLLTFTNIRNAAGKGNDVFNQATKIVTDMSSALGQDMKSSAIQVGKALNDPIKGVTALQRVGVSFTEQQKAQIKTMVDSGHSMQAQKLILGELNKEFGGAAAAQATAGEKMATAWGNFKEQVGTAILPLLDKLEGAIASKVIPTLSSFVSSLGPAFQQVGAFIAPVIAQIQGFFSGGQGGGILAGVQSFAATVRANFLPVLQTMAVTFTTKILPAVTAFASYVVSSLLPIFRQVGSIIAGQVMPIVAKFAQFLYGRLYPAVLQIVAAIASRLKPIFDQLVATYRTQVLPTLQKVLAKFHEWQPTIQQVILVVAKIIGKVLEFAAAILGKVLPPLIRFAGFLLGKAVPAVIAVIEVIARIIGKVIDFGATVVHAVQSVAKFVSGLKEKFGEAVAFVKGIPGKIKAALGNLGGLLVDAGRQIIQGLIDGITDKIGDLGAKLGSVTSFIKAHKGPPSYDKVMLRPAGRLIMGGLIDGLSDGEIPLAKKLLEVTNHMVDHLNTMRDKIKSALDGIKSDFSSLRDSIAGAFTGNLFDAQAVAVDLGDGIQVVTRSVAQVFEANLRKTKGHLSKLLAAFKKLKGWGIPSQFLSQLFASGNTDLILELAHGTKGQARGDAQLFGQVQSLSTQLGTQVAQNQYGAQIKRLEDRLATANQHLRHLDNLAHDIGHVINGAAARGQRRRSA